MRGAIPVLTRAMRVEDAHPSVGLLSGATLLAMKLVAAGRIRLSETGDSWRVGPLQPDDDDRLHALASARAHGETTVEDAEDLIRQLLDAVADTMARPPAAPVVPPVARPSRRRDSTGSTTSPRTPRTPTSPTRSGSRLRVEAPAEVLEGGGVVVVLQAHEVDDDTHVVDADRLWLAEDHGFSRRARFNLSTALRRAATRLAAAGPAPAAAGARPDGARRRRARGPPRARSRGPRRRRDRRVLATGTARRADPAGPGRGRQQAHRRAR